ncbi:hypothetical protein CP532_6664 [Ophiocordyceps camponoti-leonardi (nom. inval.)]|nr:hypothetical protein CP532_6664 [Ophiocordyceps camponoti-leonardi (nom. inval.)]
MVTVVLSDPNGYAASSERSDDGSSNDICDPARRQEVLPNCLVNGLTETHQGRGVLIPLKTTQEVRQDHVITQAYITRVPTKSASIAISAVRSLRPEGSANPLPHLRTCAKPNDLPPHMKTQLMNETPTGRQVHTGKSNWIYVIIGETKDFYREDLVRTISELEGMDHEDVFVASIPIPLLAPTSQTQAAMWSSQFWPTVYRKNNPLGPHPSVVERGTDDIKKDASVWMALAHRVAGEARKAGIGEAMGAVIVRRTDRGSELVGLAGDARRHQAPSPVFSDNPMTHCVLRAISMVAQKLVRQEWREGGRKLSTPDMSYDAFQDLALLETERACLAQDHPNKDGYLCHGLELYVTHEPCVACSMGILHSRMGKVIFCEHMPRTGGLSSDDRPDEGGRGLGLFWRRELNWSLLAWEWEREGVAALPPVDPTTHV